MVSCKTREIGYYLLKIEHVTPLQRTYRMNWYLILTKPNAHISAQKNLQRQGFEVFLPLILKTSRKAKNFITNAVPLFPNYLFVGSKLAKIPWNSLNATRGVAKVVTLDGKYRPVDKDIICGLKSRCDPNDLITVEANIKAGDYVKIGKGPFNDFICEVEKVEDNQRIWVLIELLQQKTRGLVSLDNISQTI